MESAKVLLQNVTKVFVSGTSRVEALRDITFEAGAGEFLVIVGPSGCGKSTILNLLAGFEQASSGTVLVDGEPVTRPGGDRVMLFQEAALFPWLDVRANIGFGLRHRKDLPHIEKERRIAHYLQVAELADFASSPVSHLSGGMKQRAALARALAVEPEVILLDEPFGALDALTRERLYGKVQQLYAESKKTMIFVTHNTREAACLADRIIVLTSRPGRIHSVVPVPLPRPRDFYDPEVSRIAGAVLQELRHGEEAA